MKQAAAAAVAASRGNSASAAGGSVASGSGRAMGAPASNPTPLGLPPMPQNFPPTEIQAIQQALQQQQQNIQQHLQNLLMIQQSGSTSPVSNMNAKSEHSRSSPSPHLPPGLPPPPGPFMGFGPQGLQGLLGVGRP